MRCPSCENADTRVVDSRAVPDAVRRRRECSECGARFTTHERLERRIPLIVKRDGRKEPYSEQKALAGMALACRKRPVTAARLEELLREVEARLEATRESEVPSSMVGEAVMAVLRDTDEVAYVRFASVYRQFESVEQFVDAVVPLRTGA